MITIIAAMDENNAIGFENDLPWGRSLKDDLAHFKKTTKGGSIIMGRKTFESIGSRPLSERENIVVSHQPTGVAGVLSAASIESALALARYPVFICGGGQVYEETVGLADKLVLTHVAGTFDEATVFFPALNMSEWREVSRQHFDADERNAHAFDITTYERIAK